MGLPNTQEVGYTLSCGVTCPLRESDEVNRGLANGKSLARLARENHLMVSTLQKHRRHVRPVLLDVKEAPEEPENESVEVENGPKVSNLGVLEAIIASGWKNRAKWRPTITDTLKAMEMHQRMTQGSAFQDLLDALSAGSVEEPDSEEADDLPSEA